MRRRRFREEVQSGEVLALDPQALTLMFGAMPNRDVDVTEDGVGILTIEGPLEHKSRGGWDSYESIVARFEECIERDDVRAVVLRIDSPGGDTDGLLECVRAIRDAKEASGKPVLAFADECAASAAYAIACAADEIYLPESAGVGSIGVISTLVETTAADEMAGLRFELIASGLRKADGNPHIAITDGARKRATARVQQLAGMFFELVSWSRGMTVEDVDALEADVFYGESAVDAGLADGVMTWPEVLERATSSDYYTSSSSKQSVSEPTAPRAPGSMSHMTLEALTKKKAAAKAALAKATTEKAKREAGASYRKACVALAMTEATIEARKMKKTKYVEETLSEDEAEGADEAEDAVEDADAEEAEDASTDEDATHTVTVENDEGDEDEDEGDEEDAKKMQRASYSGMSLEAKLAKLTGKSSRSAMIGAIEGAFRAAEQARRDVSKMKHDRKSEKVDGLLADAQHAGKVTRGEVPSLRQAAMTNGLGWLKANLEQRPAIIRREELMPKSFEGLAGKVPADVATVFAKMGLTKEQAEKAGALFAERNGQNGVVR